MSHSLAGKWGSNRQHRSVSRNGSSRFLGGQGAGDCFCYKAVTDMFTGITTIWTPRYHNVEQGESFPTSGLPRFPSGRSGHTGEMLIRHGYRPPGSCTLLLFPTQRDQIRTPAQSNSYVPHRVDFLDGVTCGVFKLRWRR